MFYRGWTNPSSLKITNSYGDNHWDAFERCRKKHNDNLCLETNKLVLRLDKLIEAYDGPNGPPTSSKDKSVTDLNKSMDIEWMPDDLVKLCPYCAKTFTFARRRHHCRLCGAILCNNCSGFLDFSAATKLVKPAKLYTDPYDRIEDQLQHRDYEDRPKIRLCEDCKRLLDKRLQSIEGHYCQPTFLDLYQKLRETMAETDELLLSQASLAPAASTSSRPGQSTNETNLELKSKIQDLRTKVASLSAKFKRLAERECNQKQAHLLKAINQSVIVWLGENIESKSNRLYGSAGQSQQSGRPTGWVPEQPSVSASSLDADEENPLMIQIKLLEEYIKQAKLADRYEEVGALESSKRELEIEHFIQEQQRQLSQQQQQKSQESIDELEETTETTEIATTTKAPS